LAPEVALHDPVTALDGGADGLSAYREIVQNLPQFLRPDGVAVFEAGAGQSDQICELARGAGLRLAGVQRDLGGHERALGFSRR